MSVQQIKFCDGCGKEIKEGSIDMSVDIVDRRSIRTAFKPLHFCNFICVYNYAKEKVPQ